MKVSVRVLAVVFSLCVMLQAQDERRWTINLGGGVTPVVGETKNRLNTGWNAKGGFGVNITDRFGVVFEGQYNGFGVNDAVLEQLNVPDGSAWMWSLTANPVIRLNPGGRFNPYVIAGVGFYRRTVEFTRPTLAETIVFDPWWGYFGPALVPADEVLGSISSNAIGGNAGLGFDIPIGESGTRFFTEARYHYADTERRSTSIIPVTFGIKF
ncbi:MAG TPA: outer membrane beta-barrel protein [Terriglobales bacterium]|nr:outer membrane beta-barrel protein [Terriglobales bacterium]